MDALHPKPFPFPDNIALAPGWWKSRNGMIFNIGRTDDGMFANINPDGLVDPACVFAWKPDGTSFATPFGDGEADQDFALVECVGIVAKPLPIIGDFIVAVVRDENHPKGWTCMTFSQGVPHDIWKHQPNILAVKRVAFVEGDRE